MHRELGVLYRELQAKVAFPNHVLALLFGTGGFFILRGIRRNFALAPAFYLGVALAFALLCGAVFLLGNRWQRLRLYAGGIEYFDPQNFRKRAVPWSNFERYTFRGAELLLVYRPHRGSRRRPPLCLELAPQEVPFVQGFLATLCASPA